MPDFGSALWNKPTSGDTGEGSGGASDPVTRSLRFDGSSYLSFTPSTATTTRQKAVINFWFKLAEPESSSTRYTYLFTAGTVQGSSTEWFGINYDASTSKITIGAIFGSAGGATTEAVFRDYSSWYNLHLIVDTTESSNSDKYKLYINGVLQTLTGTFPTLNSNLHIGSDKPHRFGWQTSSYHGTTYSPQVYIANAYLLENSTLPFTDFIEDTGFGSYKPKATSGLTFGTNGWHLDAQPAHDADLLVSSIDRNDGDTLFADCAGHMLTVSGNTHHDNTVGNPFGSGTAMYFDGNGDTIVAAASSDFAFGTGDFTVEGWWYFESIPSSTDAMLVDFRPTNSETTTSFAFSTDTTNGVKVYSGGNYVLGGSLSTNTWHHIALVRDSGTLYAYIDGTATGTTASFSSNLTTNSTPRLGTTADGGTSAVLTGYVFDVRITKGTARYTSSFTAPSAPFELNPVYIGGDQSGNKNHFQPTNISGHDVMLDTPTKNYAVLNPLDKPVYSSRTPAVLTEGNVKAVLDDLTGITGTIGINQSSATSSKWYVEYYYISQSGAGGDDRACFGFEGTDHTIDNSSRGYNVNLGTGSGWEFVAVYSENGAFQNMANNPVGSSLGGNVTVGDIVGVAFDLENNKFYAHKNGNWGDGSGWNQSSFSNASGMDIPSGKTWVPAIYNQGGATATVAFNGGSDPTFGGNKTSGQDTSQGEFFYAPPEGYKSLNTSNLAAPSVTPSENFEIAQWVGNETAGKVISTDISPDLVWIKNRDVAKNHTVGDSVRGANKALIINNTNTESTATTNITAFDTDESGGYSFTLGTSEKVNDSGKNHVGWVWKAHQSPTSSSTRTTYTVKVEDNSGDAWDAYGSWYDYSTYLPSVYMEIFENQNNSLVSLGKVAVRYYDSSGNSMSDTSEQTYTLECADLNAIAVTWHYDTSGDGQEYDSPCSYNDYLNDQKITILDGTSSTSGTWLGVTGQSGVDNYSNDNGCTDYDYSPPTGWADGDTLKSATTSYNGSDTATLTSDSGASDPVEKYNSAAGFTIISYSGDGSSSGDTQELDHSLGVPLEFVVAKARTSNDSYDNGNWIVYHKDLTSGDYLMLNSTAAADTPYEGYDIISTSVSGSQHKVVVGNDCDSNAIYCHYLNSGPDNGTGEDYILYGWAGVEGYSKFGSYVGNLSVDGSFIYTGFRPRFIMVKNIQDSGHAWYIHDTARSPNNYSDLELTANSSGAEYSVMTAASVERMDITSNGFKLRGNNVATNANGKTHIYAAFAESPFARANAR